MPNFTINRPSAIPTTDNAGLINTEYQQKQANWAQEQAKWDSMVGGLFGLGSAGIMMGGK